jgi:hypothetical protein
MPPVPPVVVTLPVVDTPPVPPVVAVTTEPEVVTVVEGSLPVVVATPVVPEVALAELVVELPAVEPGPVPEVDVIPVPLVPVDVAVALVPPPVAVESFAPVVPDAGSSSTKGVRPPQLAAMTVAIPKAKIPSGRM